MIRVMVPCLQGPHGGQCRGGAARTPAADRGGQPRRRPAQRSLRRALQAAAQCARRPLRKRAGRAPRRRVGRRAQQRAQRRRRQPRTPRADWCQLVALRVKGEGFQSAAQAGLRQRLQAVDPSRQPPSPGTAPRPLCCPPSSASAAAFPGTAPSAARSVRWLMCCRPGVSIAPGLSRLRGALRTGRCPWAAPAECPVDGGGERAAQHGRQRRPGRQQVARCQRRQQRRQVGRARAPAAGWCSSGFFGVPVGFASSPGACGVSESHSRHGLWRVLA